MNFSTPLSAFQSPYPVRVFDTHGQYLSGVWSESPPVLRGDIHAVVLAMSAADLEMHRHGESALCGLAIITEETLHFTDVTSHKSWGHSPEDEDCEARGPQNTPQGCQSYVEYQGLRFRVIGSGLYAPLAGCNLYHAVRSVE